MLGRCPQTGFLPLEAAVVVTLQNSPVEKEQTGILLESSEEVVVALVQMPYQPGWGSCLEHCYPHSSPAPGAVECVLIVPAPVVSSALYVASHIDDPPQCVSVSSSFALLVPLSVSAAPDVPAVKSSTAATRHRILHLSGFLHLALHREMCDLVHTNVAGEEQHRGSLLELAQLERVSMLLYMAISQENLPNWTQAASSAW